MRKLIFWAVAAFLGLAIVIIGVSQLQSRAKLQAARKEADTFVSYMLTANGGDKAFAMLTSDTQQSLDQDTWDWQAGRLSGFFYHQTAQYLGARKNPTGYAIDYSLKGTDGTYTFEVLLVQSGKSWQVQQFTNTLDS